LAPIETVGAMYTQLQYFQEMILLSKQLPHVKQKLLKDLAVGMTLQIM